MRDKQIDPNTFDYSFVAAKLAVVIPQLHTEMATFTLSQYHMHGVWQRRWGKHPLVLKIFDRRDRKEIPYYAIKELHRAVRLGNNYSVAPAQLRQEPREFAPGPNASAPAREEDQTSEA